MERRHGLVVRYDEPPELADQPARAAGSAKPWWTYSRICIRGHQRARISALGKPSGFVERQVRGWSERWKRSQTSEQPVMDQLVAWLVDRLPPDVSRAALLTATSNSTT